MRSRPRALLSGSRSRWQCLHTNASLRMESSAARATATIGRRRHSESRAGIVINPAARAVARAESSTTHCFSALQLALEPLALARADVLRRCETDELFEFPLKIIRAETCLFSEPLECDALLAQVRDVTVDVRARARNRPILRFRAIRTASLAGAESRALR